MSLSWCRCRLIIVVCLVATVVRVRVDAVVEELALTDEIELEVDMDDGETVADKRSLNRFQSSGEGMCRWTVCPPNSLCRLRGVNRQARCVCRPCDVEELSTGPVCGFDGRTYTSACKLHRAGCRTRLHIDIDYTGPCHTSCEGVECAAGKSCISDQLGLPHCLRCDQIDYCPWDSADRSPVCGADGLTYAGQCRLLEAACYLGRSVRLAYPGPCQEGLTCDKLECAPGKRCVMNDATSTPLCVDCSRRCLPTWRLPGIGTSYRLCGTDGRTYRDWCSVVRQTCSTRVLVETRHFGPCQGANE